MFNVNITRDFIQIQQVNIAIRVQPVNAKLCGWHRLHHYFSRPQVIAWLIAPEILFAPRKKRNHEAQRAETSAPLRNLGDGISSCYIDQQQ